MSRKLIVLCGNHWAAERMRSNRRPILDNAGLLGRWLSSTGAADNSQIIFNDNARGLSAILSRKSNPWSLQADILASYAFLAATYRQGDEIFLFGAGRGGYVARKLAAVLDLIGLLNPGDIDTVKKLISSYSPSDLNGDKSIKSPSQALRRSRHVRIRLLGCWDTIGHDGLPMTGLKTLSAPFMRFENGQIPAIVNNACQALALDEDRKSHRPAIWSGADDPTQTNVSQVWFAGSHQNITGGLPSSQLSDIPLLWMINKAASFGLCFKDDQVLMESNADAFGKMALLPSPAWPKSMIDKRLRMSRPVGRANSLFSRAGMLKTEKLHLSVEQRINSQFIDYSPEPLSRMVSGELPIDHEMSDLYVNARQFVRQPVDWPAVLIRNNDKLNCNLLDLSKGGAKIWFSGTLKVGTPLTLQTPMDLVKGKSGKIVWQQDNMFGLEFSNPVDLYKSA